MAHVADLWMTTVKGPDGEQIKQRTDRYGRGKRWLARWIDDDGKEKSRAFAKKKEAEDYADEMAVDVNQGRYIDPKAGEIRFGEFGKRWLESRVVDPNTDIHYSGSYRNHVEPVFRQTAGEIDQAICHSRVDRRPVKEAKRILGNHGVPHRAGHPRPRRG